MSTQQPRRIGRRTAERLLGNGATGIRNSHPRLTALLTAAAAPGRPNELTGEQVSVAAFQAAQLHPAPPPARLSGINTNPRR